MSLLDSVLGAMSGNTADKTQASPLIAILGTVLAQSGGLQGLMSKFSQAGLGNVFSSWVSTGPEPADFRRPNSAGARVRTGEGARGQTRN